MTREKLKIVPGVPFICTLETNDGKPMTSRFHDGVEYLYSVNYRGAPSLLYLPVEGAQALQRLGAKAGDEVQLLKTQTQGQAPTFVARFVSDATLAVPAFDTGRAASTDPNRRTPAPTPDEFDRHMRSSLQPPAPAQGVRMLAPRTQVAALARTSSEERSYASEPIADAPQPQPGSVLLAQCMMAAFDAALGTERYAESKGRALAFTSEDIRAMGLSVYIGKQREGR